MQKQFPKNYQKELAETIFSSTTNTNNNYFASFYNCCHPYYHSHSYHQKKSTTTTTAAVTSLSQKRTLQKNPFFIIIVALLSLCAMTVSEVVTSSPTTPFVRDHPTPPPQTPRSPFNTTTNSSHAANPSPALVHPNETLSPEIKYANESWWPKSIPTELFHSNRGTLQQQIIGVPPSWGVGCPTPGSTPPVRSSSSNNNNTTYYKSNSNNYMMKMKEAENDDQPYDRCPKPCPVISTINNILNIKNELKNSPSSNNINNNNKNSSRSSSIINDSNINYSSKNNTTTTDHQQQQQQIKEENNKHPLYFNQCLHYLQPSVFETLCNTDNQSISEFGWKISELRLPFCCEHTVESVVMASLEKEDFNVMLSEVDDDFNNEVPVRLLRTFECRRHLNALLTLDRLARKAAALFDSVLQRYDCGQIYSVHFRCEDCKDAYRRWVCASLLPYHEPRSDPAEFVPPPEPSPAAPAASDTTVASFPTSGDGEVSEESSSRPARARMRGKRRRRTWRKVRPCRNVCQQVEQRCPFFLPGDRAPGYTTQYAGEPTFLCLDPNIPETGEQFLRSPYGPDDCCFRYCDTAESIAVMMMHTTSSSSSNFSSASTGPTTTTSSSSQTSHVLRHGVCSTTTACDQQENLLNYNKSYYYESDRMVNSSTSSLNNSSANLLLSSSSTFNNNNDNTNNIDKINNNDKQPHKQCSQLSNNEKVQWNCAVSPPSSSSSSTSSSSQQQQQQQPQLTNSQQELQQSVKINNNNINNNNNNNNNNNDIKSSHHHHHHHELVVGSFQEKQTGKERTSGSGDIIDSRSAGVSFHIHYLINTAAAAPVARKRRECLLWLLFPNNNNESITIRNRSLSSLSEWWWFSIVTIILRTIDFFIYFLALLPFMLLFLLVHKRSADGYL